MSGHGETEAPASAATSADRVGTPVALTPLIGRREEIAEATRLLGQTRLLTITGAGGSGKTRLALAVVDRWLAARPGARAWWISLASLEPNAGVDLLVEQVSGVIHRRSDAAPGPGGAGAELGRGLWTSLGATDVVVLDNCEHVLDAVAELVDAWLADTPDLRLLTTSRAALTVPSERRWPLPPLGVPDVEEDGDLSSYDAVQLFADRAHQVRPDLTLDRDQVALIAAICRRLDGNPLAIELAAARLHVLGLAQLAGALDDADRVLRGGGRCTPGRHRTLWDTLDWSHRLLSPAEAELFADLGVFAGPVDLAAIESVTGRDCLDAVCTLVDHSLLRPMAVPERVADAPPLGAGVVADTGHREAVADARWFELADPVRQYARHRLDCADRGPQLRDEHLAWVAGQAAMAAGAGGHPDQSSWYARLRTYLPEIRAALGWARRSGRAEVELAIAADLGDFAIARGLHREGRSWLESALAEVEPWFDRPLVARARREAGTLAFLQCDYPAAVRHLDEAERGFREIGDESGRARCLQSLASIARERGDLAGAIGIVDDAQRCWARAGDQVAADQARIGQAFTLLLGDSVERARELAERALAAAHGRQDPGAIGDALLVLGGVALAGGDPETAADYLTDALARAERDDLVELRAYAVEWLGVVAREQGDHARSAELLAEALRQQFELGDLWRTASVLVNVAICGLRRSRPELAVRALGLAEELLARIGAELPPSDRRARSELSAELVAVLGRERFEQQLRRGRTGGAAEVVAAVQRELTASARVRPARRPGPPPRSLELRALGPEIVRVDEQVVSVAAFGYAKPRELLFFLAEQGPADKARIGLALWPDASSAELRSAFHTTLHHLRGAVGSHRVVFVDGTYRLDPTGLQYDVGRFRQGLAAARAVRTAGEPPSADAELDLLLDALKQYTGDFLAACTGAWAAATRDELGTLRGRALLAAARLAGRIGRTAEAVDAYEQLVRLDPLAEVAHRELMLCLAALGDRGRALRQYEVLSTLLRDELGVDPDPRTLAVRARIDHPAGRSLPGLSVAR